jgi:ABC-2 type transport system permease protein
MIYQFRDAFLEELKSIKNSVYKIFLIFLLPIFTFIIIVNIFNEGVLKELPIAVVDNDKSQLSRRLLNNLNNTKTLQIAYNLNSLKEAKQLFQNSKVYAIVVIPKRFANNVLLQKQPKVYAFVNTQYILIGKMVMSALSSTVIQSSFEIDFIKNLVKDSTITKALANTSAVNFTLTPYFNITQNYFYFLVLALIPAILQIFVTVTAIVVFGEIVNKKEHIKNFKDYPFIKIIAKIFPYTLFYTFIGIFFILYMYGTLDWDFGGSYSIVFLAIFLTVLAYQSVGLLFLVSGFDYARALSLGAVYTAPAFAFLGVTFPSVGMNDLSLFIRDLLPISYFMEILISQANYNLDINYEISKLLKLLLFSSFFIVVWLRFKNRAKNELS